MECNRDEAIRAKEIAEKKFREKDIMGAKKFTIKAQSLYPGLDGIQHMLATLDVYISAESRISGEADWYGILGVSPKANDETVRKHYRKLALMLHPDKNKSVGAEGAFKLISEAWSLLSDKSKRLAYDRKRNAKVFQQKVPHASGCPTAPSGSNGFSNFTKSSNGQARAQKSNASKAGTSSGPSSRKQKTSSFWTVCHRCKMHYEYLRVYLNHHLRCPNCRQAFFAIETPPPPSSGSKASTQRNHSQQEQKNQQGASMNASTSGRNNSSTSNVGSGGFNSMNSANHNNFQWGPFSKAAGPASVAQAGAQAVVKQAYERAKRDREELQAATKKEEHLQRRNHANRKTSGFSSSGCSDGVKRRKVMEDIGAVKYGNETVHRMGMGTEGAGSSGSSGLKQGFYGSSGTDKCKSSRDSLDVGIPNLLMVKARADIHTKLNEWKKSTLVGKKIGNKKPNEGEKVKDIAMVNCATSEQCIDLSQVNVAYGNNHNKFIPETSDGDLDNEPLGSMSMDVPDPDFHDFDKDRTERCFAEHQVWAAYDDDDGMPRRYAMIHNVISVDPLKMQISWLNSKTNSALGSLYWVGSGFPKTCGDFRIGKHVVSYSANSFSHKIKWTKGARGVVRVFPRKGDVWALYRDWSPAWNELTADEVRHKYDMVEVLEDYDEEFGVTVTPLVKVAGFKTIFHRHLDPSEVRRIPREEMFRFSHHVRAYLLTGQEAPNAPKGCHELDPAAIPLELLQVITDVKEEDTWSLENEGGKVDNVVNDSDKSDDEELEPGCSYPSFCHWDQGW